jgi:hypothetical protein
MRKFVVIALAAILAVTAFSASAQSGLQNVTIDGSIRIRGNFYSATLTSPAGPEIRWPGFFLPARPIGAVLPFSFATGTGNTIFSAFSGNDKDHDLDFVEQRTRLGFTADFANEVSAYIELDNYDNWSGDFRSSYITGSDFTGVSDVELYQAYIEARNMWGYPLTAKIGRQEVALGRQFLVGVNDTSSFFTGLNFDGIRLTYATDMFSVDAFAYKLAEVLNFEEDGDTDMYGIYASYLGLEDITLDAYWLFVRDGAALNDTNFIAPVEWLEDIVGVDDYDPTEIHTFGLRGAGTFGAFDFNADFAYQTGDLGQQGFLFAPFGLYGDDELDMSEWATDLEVGYTFDMTWTPRVYLGFVYYGGEDNRGVSFFDWINPFDRPEGSASFNRLFSNLEYSEFLDSTDLSNFWAGRGGVSVSPTERIDVLLAVSYFEVNEPFELPRSFNLGRYRVPIAPALSFWTEEADDQLGWEIGLYGTYQYSDDLTFGAGWAHFFTGDGLEDGSFTNGNGLVFNGTSGDDDMDYIYLETKIAF